MLSALYLEHLLPQSSFFNSLTSDQLIHCLSISGQLILSRIFQTLILSYLVPPPPPGPTSDVAVEGQPVPVTVADVHADELLDVAFNARFLLDFPLDGRLNHSTVLGQLSAQTCAAALKIRLARVLVLRLSQPRVRFMPSYVVSELNLGGVA